MVPYTQSTIRINSPMDSLLGNILILLMLLFVVGKSASWAVRAAISFSRQIGLSELAISFVVITGISILPEAIIAGVSAVRGVPSLALGTLLGSNVADLTIVLAAAAIFSPHVLRANRSLLDKDHLFLGFLLIPLALGFTGHFSRLDGLLLVGSGIFFSILMYRSATPTGRLHALNGLSVAKSVAILAASLLCMGAGAFYTVEYAVRIAGDAGLNSALIGLLVVSLGTTLPELLFSIRAVRLGHSTLAIGDILGTVVADATLVLGITALIHPFSFNPRLVILTGFFMLFAGILALSFLRSERTLTRSEAAILFALYGVFVAVEFFLRDCTPLSTP